MAWWFTKRGLGAGGAPRVDGYEFALKRRDAAAPATGADLIVVLSSSRRFALYKHDFGRDALYVADPQQRYFLRKAKELAAEVTQVVERGGYDRVIFMGSSKGGFGALSTARLCARMRPERTFHVVAFSPQVKLYPFNPALYFSSYRRLHQRAGRHPMMKRALRGFGDVSGVGGEPNLVLELVYARDSAVDRDEAMRISGPNVSRRTVAGATHGTAFHFMCHGLDRAAIRSRIKRAYRRTGDQDLQQTRPADVRALVKDILQSALREPPLNELIDEVLSRRAALGAPDGRPASEAPDAATPPPTAPSSVRRLIALVIGAAEKTRAFAPGKY